MEWMFEWHHWKGRWYDVFPEETYGVTVMDTHIYKFYPTVEEAKAEWERKVWPKLEKVRREIPLFVGEYTLALNRKVPED